MTAHAKFFGGYFVFKFIPNICVFDFLCGFCCDFSHRFEFNVSALNSSNHRWRWSVSVCLM